MFYLYLIEATGSKDHGKTMKLVSVSLAKESFSPLYNFSYSTLQNASFTLQIVLKNLFET